MLFGPVEKLLWHGDRVKEWLETGRTAPVLVEIAPTGYCNASCPWCFFKDRKANVKVEALRMLLIIEDLAILRVKSINWTGGGEPTLHPNFKNFVEHANMVGLKQGIFSNGYQEIPHQDSFEWIRISLTDAGFDRIVKPRVPFGICVNHTQQQSESDLKRMCLQARDFGARYFQVRPALIGDYITQPELDMPEYLKEYRTTDFDVYVTGYKYQESIKPRDYDSCYGYHFCPSIDWEARLSACLYLSDDPRFILGDLKKESLLDVWPKIRKQLPVMAGCQNCCKNHEINKVLSHAVQVRMVDFP